MTRHKQMEHQVNQYLNDKHHYINVNKHLQGHGGTNRHTAKKRNKN